MIERRIKDLSIAIEALSRCNTSDQTDMRYAVERILEKEIAVAARQQEERAMASKTDPMDEPFTTAKKLDDEIPF